MLDASAAPTKVCAACGGRFPTDALFCPTDGTPLQSAAAAEREATDPYLGQELAGHIEIRQLIGVGAMGRVYRAFQRGIDRDVAVKILHRELSANTQLVSRFTREAKVASRLQHPNVVQVLLAGQLPDRALYMVMEYLDGLSLQSALAAASGSLPLPRALHIALQLCDAVGEAHTQGIVHRDLKPENVMLVRRGSDPDCVKVLDFGIARINWGEQSVATAAGLIFGTARYISPEGAQGNAVGPASDVYAIGTLLYQMLAGRTPFDSEQAVGLLVQQIHDPAPPLRGIPQAAYVPASIADVVMAALAKDPAKREPDARALGQAIFDAAKAAGLSPDDFARPQRRSQALQLAPLEKTTQLDTSPVPPEAKKPLTGSTAKWEPPEEFQARLREAETPKAARISSVDATMDDASLDEQARPRISAPFFPAPSDTREARQTPETPRTAVPATLPGDELRTPDAPRTQYTPPLPDTEPRRPASSSSSPTVPPSPTPRRRSFLLVVACFLLGAALAAGYAWKTGKFGAGAVDVEHDQWVARATDAMFKNRFQDPPGENVRDLTDEGLRRWPNDRRLLDVRVRAASELTSQAIAQRSAGDVVEALKLAKLAHELDPHDASTKRLVEQYEAELASFSPSAAPTLVVKPPPATPTSPTRPTPKPPGPPPPGPPPPGPPPVAVEYKVLLELSQSAPRLGQTVDFIARVAPAKADLGDPSFLVAGPGSPGVRLPAQAAGPGTFKASYAFLESGKFDVTFTAQADAKPLAAKRSLTAGSPAPAPVPTPSTTGSVKWM